MISMKNLIEFYKSLDVLSTIFFWCVIIILILLIIFTILLIKETKKIKKKIINNEEPITEEENNIKIEIEPTSTETIAKEEEINVIEVPSPAIEEEKEFVAEEHVMEYNADMFTLPDIKKATEEVKIEEPKKEKEPFVMPTKPYERNVLREMDLSQTSPIGIIKKEDINNYYSNKKVDVDLPKVESDIDLDLPKVEVDAKLPSLDVDVDLPKVESDINLDLPEVDVEATLPLLDVDLDIPKVESDIDLDLPEIDVNTIEENDIEEEPVEFVYETVDEPVEEDNEEMEEITEDELEELTVSEDNTSSFETYKKQTLEDDNAKYIEEVSKKLSEAELPDEVERTEYELKQEEDAIISFKELMERKDTIDVVDEEDAVISIGELMERKKEEEKLYNITEEEENDEFLRELKKFRSDL